MRHIKGCHLTSGVTEYEMLLLRREKARWPRREGGWWVRRDDGYVFIPASQEEVEAADTRPQRLKALSATPGVLHASSDDLS